jgi:hypothetical protein
MSHDHEPHPDPLTGGRLRALEDPRPRSEADWRRLAARIGRAARTRLAALRREPTWWEEMAGWTDLAVPVGLAAAIMALVFIARVGSAPIATVEARAVAAADSSAPVTGFLSALTQGQDEPAVAYAAVGPLSTDWFLQTAVGQ